MKLYMTMNISSRNIRIHTVTMIPASMTMRRKVMSILIIRMDAVVRIHTVTMIPAGMTMHRKAMSILTIRMDAAVRIHTVQSITMRIADAGIIIRRRMRIAKYRGQSSCM